MVSSSKPAPKPASGRSAPRTPPQEVRIIGGLWKRSKLPVPAHDGLRPTPNRVRETLFNWLGQDLTGWRCIDAFAGSGALGLEAASRGAAEVLLVEQDAAQVHSLRATATRLKASGVGVEREDALQALRRRAGRGFNLVFLDPPFLDGQNDTLVRNALAASLACLAPQGFVYLESPRAWGPDELATLGLAPHKTGKAGAVHFALLQAA
jgi:16S rRNA (guanine(966)-N(2))-methyltransferase RsmD